ncbi:DUF438 domain-containing protein [Enterococcus alishanensis]|uniref:DUF438 domain-containing protein n=1 Tax=Enterococcus alishanensis TaxID=1303817 RepID=A0ABS6TAU6_9ENTE|nr:DUF438 domain-containing protein [Enterococcus alishanensis]MBV7390031.1 DUF438 domain-containing protein [Enterococcus alishanensis]
MDQTKAQRQEKIVEILSLLHQGGSFEEAKEMFNQEFDGIDVTEITAAEKALIQSGLAPTEIQKLCNIHAAVFKGSINEIHRSDYEHEQPGHPVAVLKLENQVLQSLLTDEVDDLLQKIKTGDWSQKERLLSALTDLKQIDKHYARKETIIFSYMEKYGITAPPKVMWGVDDNIREMLKELITYLDSSKAAFNPLFEKWTALKTEIEEMIFKEEEIMVPMTLDVFSLADWEKIAADSFDIGYAFIPEPLPWKASEKAKASEIEREPARQIAIAQAKETTDGIAAGLELTKNMEESITSNSEIIGLPTGSLQLKEMVAIFQVLPVDLTFVDKNDIVRFYSEGKSRVFPRTNSVLGREVINCHPPKSMHVVQQILDDFRAGVRETADFWIDMKGMKVYIRYFALKDQEGEYLGCLEVTQDITKIQKIEGQNRLLDE